MPFITKVLRIWLDSTSVPSYSNTILLLSVEILFTILFEFNILIALSISSITCISIVLPVANLCNISIKYPSVTI